MSETCKTLLNDFSISIHIAQYLENVSWNCPEAVHPCWFIFWNPEPGAFISCGGESFAVTPEQAFVVPPYTVISAFSRTKFPHFYAHFDCSEPFSSCCNQIYRLSPEPAKRFFKEYFSLDKLHKALKWRIMIMEYLTMLPLDVWEHKDTSGDPRIKKVLDIVLKNINEPWSNAELASLVNMSENNFYRCFRTELGISPQRYIKSLQLNEAKHMLLNSTISIEDIARRCGFADRYSFSKAFKAFFAVSPGFFRHNQEKFIAGS